MSLTHARNFTSLIPLQVGLDKVGLSTCMGLPRSRKDRLHEYRWDIQCLAHPLKQFLGYRKGASGFCGEFRLIENQANYVLARNHKISWAFTLSSRLPY